MNKELEKKMVLEVKTNNGISTFTGWELEELDEFLFNNMENLNLIWYEITVRAVE